MDSLSIRSPGAILVIFCLTITGCSSTSVTSADVSQVRQQRVNVPVYDSSRLTPGTFIRLAKISASDCDDIGQSGPSRNEATAILAHQAESMGADAITDVECTSFNLLPPADAALH